MKLKSKRTKGSKALIVIAIVLIAIAIAIGIAVIAYNAVDDAQSKEMSSLDFSVYPTKRSYYVGETFDPSGIKMQAMAKNGDSTYISNPEELEFSGFDSSVPCEKQWITVTYMGVSAQFDIEIIDPNATPPAAASVEMFNHYDTYTLSYWREYGFFSMGAKLRITYDDGTTEEITLDPQWIFDIDRTITSPGTTYITIKYPLDDETVIEAKVPITITE